MFINANYDGLEIAAIAVGEAPCFIRISREELKTEPMNKSWKAISHGFDGSEEVFATLCARTRQLTVLKVVTIFRKKNGLLEHEHEQVCVVETKGIQPRMWLLPP